MATANKPSESGALPRATTSLTQEISISLHRHTARRGFFILLLGVVINHIRRILLPWLFQFVYTHPFADLKLARSSPHYFLESGAARASWGHAALWALMELGSVLLETVLISVSAWKRKEQKQNKMDKRMDEVLDVAEVVMLLARGENMFAETCWVSANIYAYATLISSGETTSQLFLRTLIISHWRKIILHAILILRWAYFTALSVMTKAVQTLTRGRPQLAVAVGVVWSGTAYLVRYSNKYFVLLEMSDMWVTFCWMGLGIGALVVRTWTQWRGLDRHSKVKQ